MSDDFGHRPVWVDVGYCGGCAECGDREEREICVRCATVEYVYYRTSTDGEPFSSIRRTIAGRYASLWPCTSAVVLGVAQREEEG